MRTFKNISSRFVTPLAALLVASLAIGALAGCKKKEPEAELTGAPTVPAVPAPADPAAPAAPAAPADPAAQPPPVAPAPSPAAPVPAPAAPAAAPNPYPGVPVTPAPSQPAPAQPAPSQPAGVAPTTPAPQPAAADIVSVLGQPCGANDACPAGTACKTYYGIAGPQGPAFKSCEIPCDSATKTCPAGSNCVTVADGPGSVCRP